jgi:YegS/Rv2252/BmrU family lipid kinase
MTRYKVIVNPISGRGAGEKSYPLIESLLQQYGLNFDMCHTTSPGHAIQLAEDASENGFDVVVAAGGDGTANEVLNGLVRARQNGNGSAALGVISVGRGNDFAYGIDTPMDLETACRSLAENKRKWIDAGFVQGGEYPEGRYFGNGVGIGFDAVVGFEALKLKRLSGFPSYIVAALKTIFLYFQAPMINIEFNNKTLTQPALMVSVMNGRRLGGGFMMAPKGLIDDGLFDLCIAGQVSRVAIFALILKFMQGTQAGHPAIQMDRTGEINVSAVNGVLPAHADGETLCTTGEKLELKIIPKALEVIIPAETQAP